MTTPATPTTLTFLAPAYLAEPNPEADAAASDEQPVPTSADEPEPAGKRLATALGAALRARAWHVDYAWATYTGHAFDARRVTNRYDVELALLDRDRGAWRLTAKRRTGLLQNLLKRKPGEAEEVEHQLLRAHLEEALRADPEVSLDDGAAPLWKPESA